MSRQVLLGGVIGFLLTVVVMAVCQKSEPVPPAPAAGPTRVNNLEPMQFDAPKKPMPAVLPARPPIGNLPSVARPLHLEGFDAGHR